MTGCSVALGFAGARVFRIPILRPRIRWSLRRGCLSGCAVWMSARGLGGIAGRGGRRGWRRCAGAARRAVPCRQPGRQPVLVAGPPPGHLAAEPAVAPVGNHGAALGPRRPATFHPGHGPAPARRRPPDHPAPAGPPRHPGRPDRGRAGKATGRAPPPWPPTCSTTPGRGASPSIS